MVCNVRGMIGFSPRQPARARLASPELASPPASSRHATRQRCARRGGDLSRTRSRMDVVPRLSGGRRWRTLSTLGLAINQVLGAFGKTGDLDTRSALLGCTHEALPPCTLGRRLVATGCKLAR